MGGEQDAILERAGLAFVGIADHVARLAMRLAQASISVRCETAPPRPRRFDVLSSATSPPPRRERRGERVAGREFAAEQKVLAQHLVVDAKVFRGQSASATSLRIRSQISSTRALVMRVIA